jgi:adenosylhomocysteinase
MTSFEQALSWTQQHMPITERTLAALPDLRGVRLACSMHLEVKMAPTLAALLAKGAQLFLTTCNPSTVDDEVVAWLRARGAETCAWRDMSPSDFAESARKATDWEPTHLCEMGAEITLAYLARGARKTTVRAGLEATGSGTLRLHARHPPYPIFNWDDVPIKEGLHNRHMVGLVACHAFFQTTRLTFHRKRVLVVGYGLVGRGVCDAARAYGAAVVVAETNPARALEAAFSGWHVEPLEQALPTADVVITATGARHVIGPEHLPLLKDGTFLVNVGHVAEEIDVPGLYAHPHEEALPSVERIRLLPTRTVYLFAGGSMANLTAGHGDSLNAFDVVLAILVAGVGFLIQHGEGHAPGLYLLPEHAWMPVTRPA